MKRFYSKKAKILSAIACIFFTACFFVCLAATYIFKNTVYTARDGVYGDVPKFELDAYYDAGNAYAVQVLSKYDSGFTSELLDKMNCYYGVIEGDITNDTDLNDNSIYLYRNFDGINVPLYNDYFIESYVVNNDSIFSSSDKFLGIFGADKLNYIRTDEGRREESIEVQGIGYDDIGKKAYVYSNDQFYALDAFWYVKDDYYSDDELINVDSIFNAIWYANKQSIEDNSEENEKLYIAGNGYDPISTAIEGFKLCLISNNEKGLLNGNYVADLSPIHNRLKEIYPFQSIGTRFTSLGDMPTIRAEIENPGNKHYTFICFPNETKLETKGHVNDYYAKARKFVGIANTIKYISPIIGIISMVMIWISFVLFLKAAGHTKQSEEIVESPFDKIPIDLAFVVTIILEYVFLAMILSLKYKLPSYLAALGIGVIFILAMITGLCFCSMLAVNFKLRRLHKNTLCAKTLLKVKWKRRLWILYLIMLIPALFANSINSTLAFPVFIVDMVILALFLSWGMHSYSKIKESVENLAAGDTTARVDVTGMPQFMEETGTALNDIQAGIEIALAERTKSERMKTELITNVSHDIKTPITSIINYVDLLNKENLENENAKEYLEVLNRQSLRLKKLVEDIIEASKISSGNIELNMEKVNAEVLLDQSIGEFAERLKEKKIEVVVNSCGSEMYLMADNRYLWRVFDNIMSNIVKYAQADTRAYVDLEKDGDKLRFTFRNISREQLNISPEELMERFVRGDKSRYTDGNGLGLSIANSLTQAMGGTMNIFIDGDFFKVILEFDAITESED